MACPWVLIRLGLLLASSILWVYVARHWVQTVVLPWESVVPVVCLVCYLAVRADALLSVGVEREWKWLRVFKLGFVLTAGYYLLFCLPHEYMFFLLLFFWVGFIMVSSLIYIIKRLVLGWKLRAFSLGVIFAFFTSAPSYFYENGYLFVNQIASPYVWALMLSGTLFFYYSAVWESKKAYLLWAGWLALGTLGLFFI